MYLRAIPGSRGYPGALSGKHKNMPYCVISLQTVQEEWAPILSQLELLGMERHHQREPTVWHRGGLTAFRFEQTLAGASLQGGAPSHSGVLPPEACFGHRITVVATCPCQGTLVSQSQGTARRGATTKQQHPRPRSRRRIAELALHTARDSNATATAPMTDSCSAWNSPSRPQR